MPDESASGMKAVLKEPAEKSFVFRECDHAVANVAGWKNAVFAAESPGAAAIISDCHNRREVGYGPVRIGMLVAAADYVLLESPKKS